MPGSKESSLRSVLRTSIPAAVDLSSQTVAWLIEAILVGQMLSAAALAGQGLALQMVILTLTVVLTFVVGASIIINRYLGADDTWKANHVLAQALILGSFLSLIIALSWYYGATFGINLIWQDQPEARLYAIDYLETLAWFGPLIILNFIGLGIMRMAGDTLITMKINLFTNVLHILLDFVLIPGLWIFPRMEVQGTAIAAGIAHSLAFFITFLYLRNRKSSLFLSLNEFTSPNFDTFKKLFRLGAPTTVEQSVWAIGQVVLSFYAGHISVLVLAAHTVFVRIQSVLTMGFQGLGLASMTLVGQQLGADNKVKAKLTGHTAGRVALMFGIVLAMGIYLLKGVWMPIFTSDQAVILFGAQAITVLALIQIPKAMNIVFTGNLRGGADLSWLMWLTIGSVVSLEIFGAYVLSFVFNMSLLGLWLVQGIDETFRLGANYWRFQTGKWSGREIV